MSSGSDGVLYGGASRVVRSQPARPAGPETKSMASRAMAYRSACIASGVNRWRARLGAAGAGRGPRSASCGPPRAVTLAAGAVQARVVVIVAVAGRIGVCAVQGDAGRGPRRGGALVPH